VPETFASVGRDLPLVSAIVNTFNYGRFVEEAVESVLAQDYPVERLDIIVVDDGSTDDTPKRIERFGNRIRYFRLPHRGQAAALNFGIGEARGQIVAFLDADDVWLPQKIRRVVQAVQATPDVGLVYHAFEVWRMDGRPEPQQDFQALSGFLPADERKLLAFDGQATSGQAFRIEVLREMLPLPEEFVIGCSDGFLAYSSIFEWPAVAIAEALTRYRIHGENLFSFERPNADKMRVKLMTWQALMREHRAWLERRGHDLNSRGTTAFLRRQELAERLMRFALSDPGRWEFFQFQREELSLYHRLWTRRYRLFKSLSALAGLVLGFRQFYRVKNSYRCSVSLRGLRESALPRMQQGTLSKAPAVR
jgi:glycosyltransferase involved in cell wall biosynthesis